jgi:predicted TIM-barrel fold metal-dependent hydrolase
MFASDFPHEANLERCREEIELLVTHSALDDEARTDVFARNARRFYRLDATGG